MFYDLDNREIVATGSVPLDLCQTDEKVAEQEASWWLQALQTSLAAIDPAIRETTRAISMSGQQHGFVAVDKSGEVLAPVKLWCDTSTENECAEIMAAVGGREACMQKSGNPILPGYTASKIRWIFTTAFTKRSHRQRPGVKCAGSRFVQTLRFLAHNFRTLPGFFLSRHPLVRALVVALARRPVPAVPASICRMPVACQSALTVPSHHARD